MDHGQIQNRFSAYLDGEIGELERAHIEAHCHECGECAAILADLREVSGLVRGSRAVVSAAMMPRLHQAIDAKMRRHAERLVGWLSALAASLALAAGLQVAGTQATARAPVAWEGTAVRLADDPDSSREAVVAQWIVTNLSDEVVPATRQGVSGGGGR